MQDSLKSDRKIVIGMVGLPARGKVKQNIFKEINFF